MIEDNCDTADSMCLVLKLRGHAVAVAYNGADGVRMAKEWQPEIVLCDIGLPGMDGFHVAAEIRKDPATATAVLIAISGYAEQPSMSEAQAIFDHYLLKPADPSQLENLFFAWASRHG